MICLILPALFYIKLQKTNVRGDKIKRFLCYVTVVFAAIASVVGIFASVKAIVLGRSN